MLKLPDPSIGILVTHAGPSAVHVVFDDIFMYDIVLYYAGKAPPLACINIVGFAPSGKNVLPESGPL